MPAASAAPVTVTDIAVRADRLVLAVVLTTATPRETTPELAKALVRAVPSLPAHACVNGHGATFGAVLDDTSIPHVLEHLIIDAQVRAAARSGEAGRGAFVGTTCWVDRQAGRARVEVSYADDLVALAAVKQALATLNGVLEG